MSRSATDIEAAASELAVCFKVYFALDEGTTNRGGRSRFATGFPERHYRTNATA